MKVTVTLEFDSTAEAAAALGRLAAPAARPVIAHDDRPDVGAPPAPVIAPVMPPAAPAAPAAPIMDPAVAFAGAAVPTQPAAPAVPPPPADAVPPAPPASMPPSAATAPTAAPAVERDSAGMPWDARIHASSKSKIADGTWRSKRNVDDALRATVEAELKGAAAPAAPAAPATPAAPAVPPPPAAATPPAAPAAPAGPRGFPQYMVEVGAAFTANPLKANAASTKAAESVGLQNIGQLVGKPELIEQFDAVFQREMAA